MAGAIVLSTVASCVLTELIRNVTECALSARRCRSEWKKLEKELKEIQPDVEEIEKKMVELEKRDSESEHKVLKMVKAWLERLKEKMDLANIEVHRCHSSRFHFDHKLSVKLTSMSNDIASTANTRLTLFIQLNQFFPDQGYPSHQHPPAQSANKFEVTAGESILRRRREEVNDILHREESTRLSQRQSSHNGHSFPNSPYFSPDSSQHSNGYDSSGSSHFAGDSSVHSSSGGYESSGSPHAHHIMSQQIRNEAMQLEAHTGLFTNHAAPLLHRRYTMDSSGNPDVTQSLPHMQNNHRLSYPGWLPHHGWLHNP